MFHMWEWGMGMGWFWMLIFWSLIIGITVAVVYVLLNSRKHNQASQNSNLTQSNAVERIKERYAKGEINREEYKQIMKDLEE